MKGPDYTAARAKVDRERICRVARLDGFQGQRCHGPLETAHILGRKHDRDGVVNEDGVVGLCRFHHREYDLHRFDLLPYLTIVEQAYAVGEVGIAAAVRRICSARDALADLVG